MATSQALIKYYDCLRDSFNKIQDKDNKSALVNAALRPKIREEFEKNHEVLYSYLNYIQVFSIVYDDSFSTICNNIIVPLFKEIDVADNKRASRIHETLETVLKSKPEFTEDFVNSVIKIFPGLIRSENELQNAFLIFLKNSLKICLYLEEEYLLILVSKIFDRLNPPPTSEQDLTESTKASLTESYEYIFEHLDELGDKFVKATTIVFNRDFIATSTEDNFKFLILYMHNNESIDILLDSLWETFMDSTRSIDERRASINYAGSFIARANYITLEQLFEQLERYCKWCYDIIERGESELTFNVVVQSILYIITQRYREMYEEESMIRLKELNLQRIIDCSWKPLENCDPEIEKRFKEVAKLYRLVDFSVPPVKRRRSDSRACRNTWTSLFPEDGNQVPDKMRSIYRSYFHHNNFTINRDE